MIIIGFHNIKKAVERNPKVKPMFHSDRGYQYTSKSFNNLLNKHNMIQSMSRVGKCIDNGPIENLWGLSNLKCIIWRVLKSLINL